MERRLLGRTGLSVGVIGLGTATFGGFGLKNEDDCARIVHQALDAGLNLVDTADFYGLGLSETITGKALAGRRDKVVLATKCGSPMSNDPNERGGSRRWINRAIDASLKRLGTDHVDIYQLHQPDPFTDAEETAEAMNGLISAGKIRYWGTSNFSAAMITESQLRARMRNLTPGHTEQTAYSIFTRGPEAELLPACRRYGLGFLAYSPLDGGWLSGRYRKDQEIERSPRQRLQPDLFDLSDPAIAAKLDIVEDLCAIAEADGQTLSELAVGFALAHPGVTAALVGGSRAEHYAPYFQGRDWRLTDEVLDRIDAVARPGVSKPAQAPRNTALTDKTERRRSPHEAEASAARSATNRVLELQQRKKEG